MRLTKRIGLTAGAGLMAVWCLLSCSLRDAPYRYEINLCVAQEDDQGDLGLKTDDGKWLYPQASALRSIDKGQRYMADSRLQHKINDSCFKVFLVDLYQVPIVSMYPSVQAPWSLEKASPVTLSRAWVSGRYLNLTLESMFDPEDDPSDTQLVLDSLDTENRAIALKLYHFSRNDGQAVSLRGTFSCPLDRLPQVFDTLKVIRVSVPVKGLSQGNSGSLSTPAYDRP